MYGSLAKLVEDHLSHLERVTHQSLRGKIIPVIVRSVTYEILPGGFYVDSWSRIGPRSMGSIAGLMCFYDPVAEQGLISGGDVVLTIKCDPTTDSQAFRHRVVPASTFGKSEGKTLIFERPDFVWWRMKPMKNMDRNRNAKRRMIQLIVFPPAHRSLDLLQKLELLTSRHTEQTKHAMHLLSLLRWGYNMPGGFSLHPRIVNYIASFLVISRRQAWRKREEIVLNIRKSQKGYAD